MAKRNPTIKDVAITANVSIATVSNVVNGKDALYSPETADVVWAAVRGLDYRPNRVARSLKSRCTFTLGVVIDHTHGRLTQNTYVHGLLDGFLECATRAGYQIKLFSLLMEDENTTLAQLEDGSVDGLALFAPPAEGPLVAWARQANLPLVFAGGAPTEPQYAAVDCDDRGAARAAVRWLIEQGHTRIAWLSGLTIQWSSHRREEGYRQAMQEAGLPIRPEWRTEGDWRMESGMAGAQALMRADSTLTAIVAWNDTLALGAIQGLHASGVRVPEDVSVIGFDDMEAARWVRPALTTVRQPTNRIGFHAAELLLRQIKGEPTEPGPILLSGELILRESAAPPRPDK